MRRRRRVWTQARPWSEEEDARLADMVALGVTSDAWPVQLPGRTFGEVAERRLDLGLSPRILI